ncbi:sugar phosphate isomerase/epimerase [Tropicimonas sp. IMCC34043]|uniref:sugar phosphate isomerase/epimerase family protein n=1 Tax=Tropicimonas sp. IMCC34043 TaxID=2248760 RepID=UPI000E239138|nr:sugar phosphate isomerase/epimerase [Tropicimonas sp. IMCC34043]
MPSVSLAHLSMIDARPDQLVEAAAAGGFDGVGLRINTTLGLPGEVDLVNDRKARADLRHRLDATGLKVLDVEAFGLTPTVDLDGFEPALDLAAELGAKNLLCTGPDEDPVRLRDRFAAFCQRAATRKITVGLEFIPYLALKTLGAARDLLWQADQPNAGLLLDTLHFSRSGGAPEQLAGLTSRDFAFVQLCDARALRPAYADLVREARTDRLAPGEGSLWLDRLMPMLPRDRHLSIEAPVAADAALPFNDRARHLGAATRSFLASQGWL